MAFYLAIFITFFSVGDVLAQSKVFVIAKINNQAITNIDLIDRYKLVLKISKINIKNFKNKRAILDQVLQKMIDEKLQVQQAKDLGIGLDQEKFNRVLKEFAKEKGYKNSKYFNRYFSGRNLSYDSFIKQIESQILWSDIIKNVIAPKIKVGQLEIEELLELRNVQSKIEKFFLSEIFIPFDYQDKSNIVDGKELAFKLYEELKDDDNFDDIVKQFSRSATAEFDGEIGWVGPGDVDAKIYNIISKVKIGKISQPIAMKDGYYLFKISDKKTFSALTKEDLEQVKDVIFNRKLQLMTKSYLMDLRKGAYIQIDRKAVAGLRL